MSLIRYFKSLLMAKCHQSIKVGDRFEVIQKVKRTAIYDIQGPMTDGFKCEIQAGSIMSCKREPADNSILFYLWPENPEIIEQNYEKEKGTLIEVLKRTDKGSVLEIRK